MSSQIQPGFGTVYRVFEAMHQQTHSPEFRPAIRMMDPGQVLRLQQHILGLERERGLLQPEETSPMITLPLPDSLLIVTPPDVAPFVADVLTEQGQPELAQAFRQPHPNVEQIPKLDFNAIATVMIRYIQDVWQPVETTVNLFGDPPSAS